MDDALPLDLFGNTSIYVDLYIRTCSTLCSGSSLLPTTQPFQLWPVLIIKALYRVLHAFGLQDEKETSQVQMLDLFARDVTQYSVNRFPYCIG